jgi:hypothetical protein
MQRWRGHTRASITTDVYSHVLDEGLGDTPFAPMLTALSPSRRGDSHPS